MPVVKLTAFFLGAGLLFLLSCNSGRKDSSNGDPGPDTVTVKGIYTYGQDISRFMECGNDSVSYWLSDPDSALQARAKEYEFFPQSFQSVYAELEATKLPPATGGFAAEYDSLLKVVKVLKVEAKNFKTECFPYDFWCLGNEPFWSVEISGSENVIRLTEVGIEKVYHYQYAEPAVEGEDYSYDVPAEGDQPALKIEVRKEECSDGMSDRNYDYSVAVKAGDRTLKGCAIAGEAIKK